MAQGSIYPRTLADRRTVVYDVRYRTSDGHPAQKRGFARRRDAQRWLHERMSAVDRGEVIAHSSPFGEYFDAWLAEHRPRVEEGTYRDYEIHGRLRLKPCFGECKLSEISARDVRRYVAALAASERYCNKTINNSLVVLRLCLAHAYDDGLISKNPAASRPGARERIKLPAEHREMDYLRLREIPRYLGACDGVYRPLAETLIATGMRISEALALTWRDVDFDAHAIRVMRSAKRDGVGSTKGDRFRAVELGPRLLTLMRDLHARRSELHRADSSPDLVFVGPRGGVLDGGDVSREHHKHALEGAGLRDMRLHDLRHTAAASWLASGLPLIYVQRQLGHASIETTQREYGHLEESFLRDAAASVEKLIWEAGEEDAGRRGRQPRRGGREGVGDAPALPVSCD